MNRFYFVIFLITFSSAFSLGQKTTHCFIETTLGSIKLELYPEKAEKTVSNILYYVDNKLYDNSSFFRVCTPENESEREIKIEVIQGGNVANEKQIEPINIETTEKTGLLHKNGTISMARGGPNSATSSFFICINDQPELDFGGKRNADGLGFAAFGKVIEGMHVVNEIQSQKNEKQRLIQSIKIVSIRKR